MEVYVTSRYVINTYNSVIALLARPSNTGCVSSGKERFISSWWSIIHHKWLDFEMVSTSLQVVEWGPLTVSRYRWAKLYFPSNSSSGASTNVANYAQIGNCIGSKTSSWSYNGLTSWVEPRLVSVFCTNKSNIIVIKHGALWLSWLRRLSCKQEILGSNPSRAFRGDAAHRKGKGVHRDSWLRPSNISPWLITFACVSNLKWGLANWGLGLRVGF